MKRKQFKSGIYTPINPEKCLDNKQKFVYRSSYEMNFFRFCDLNPKVIKWGAEVTVIPYICKTDGKLHRYYIDNKLILENSKGELKTYLIEIKPYNQTIAPKPSKRKKKQTVLYESFQYLKNQSKWNSASQYCLENGFIWCILTEKGYYQFDNFVEGSFF